MIIAIDVDEVLAQLVEELLPYHNEHFGTDHGREHCHTYALEHVWECSRQEAVERVVQFARSGGFERLSTQPGSQEAMRQLAEQHTLIALTARFGFLEQTTRNWLDEHFPDCFSDVILTNQYGVGEKTTKGAVCLERDVDLLIEDDLEHVADASEHGVPVLLMDAPWNRTRDLPENVTRVRSWDEVLTRIAS